MSGRAPAPAAGRAGRPRRRPAGSAGSTRPAARSPGSGSAADLDAPRVRAPRPQHAVGFDRRWPRVDHHLDVGLRRGRRRMQHARGDDRHEQRVGGRDAAPPEAVLDGPAAAAWDRHRELGGRRRAAGRRDGSRTRTERCGCGGGACSARRTGTTGDVGEVDVDVGRADGDDPVQRQRRSEPEHGVLEAHLGARCGAAARAWPSVNALRGQEPAVVGPARGRARPGPVRRPARRSGAVHLGVATAGRREPHLHAWSRRRRTPGTAPAGSPPASVSSTRARPVTSGRAV